jgi:8-oxo-dGTP diphosphatase
MLKVTCALIVNKGKLLVAQMSAESAHPMQWEFPGGKIKKGESAEHCIKREIREELDIVIDVETKLKPVIHDYVFRKIQLIPFICSIESGVISINEHIAFKWLELNQLHEINLAEADKKLIGLEENKQILEKYFGEKMNNTR